jgi:hypothetical protein
MPQGAGCFAPAMVPTVVPTVVLLVACGSSRRKVERTLASIRSLATFSRPSRSGERRWSEAIFGILGGLERKRVSYKAWRISELRKRFGGRRASKAARLRASAVRVRQQKPRRSFQVKGLILAQNERWRRG